MVVSATKDSFQFSVDQAKISLAKTSGIYELYQQPQRLRHAIFESPHDYNREMREAMYGWMALHLRGEGDGSPIAEPELMTEEPEELRCYPQGQRPADFVTLPQLAARFGREALAKRKTPDHLEFWMAEEAAAIQGLPELLGGFPKRVESKVKVEPLDAGAAAHLLAHLETIRFQAEEGIELIAWRDVPTAGRSRLALILDAEQGLKVLTSDLSKKLREQGWDQAALELRATGGQAYERDKIGRAADHTTAEWSLWIGRPLVGQWVWDVVRLLDAMAEKDGGLPEELMLVGQGTAATVALIAGALHPAVDHVVTVQGLASFVTEVPYVNQRLGLMVPGLLPSIGDVAQLAALVSPRRLTVCGGVDGGGNSLDAAKLEELFQATRVAYRLEGAGQSFRIIDSIDQLQ